MDTAEQSRRDVATAVEATVSRLLSTRHSDRVSLVSLPMFYPSGAAITVSVEPARERFYVTDGSFAFREAAMIGGESIFNRIARNVADFFGVEVTSRTLSVIAERDQLAGAIADIAAASGRVAHAIVERVANRHENEIALHLYQRLVAIFGPPRVEPEAKIVGASSKEWDISALVHLEDHTVVFDAVANHHASVYSSATKFHDLALLEKPPVAVSVVRDKKALGAFVAILAQASHVIQDNVPDEVFARAAQLPGARPM